VANRRQGLLAFALQNNGAGHPKDDPDYTVPFSTGGGPKAVRDRADLPVTRPTTARSGQFVQRAHGEGTVTILAHEEPLGLLAYASMGQEEYIAPGGSGGHATLPTHYFYMDEELQFLTVWAMLGGNWWRFPDTLVQVFGLASTSGDNVLVNLGLTSFHFEPNVAEPTWTLTPDIPRFKHIGSNVKIDPLGRHPEIAGQLTNIENLTLEIRRNPVLRYGTELTPQLAVPIRELDLTAGLTYDPDQLGWDPLTVASTGSLTGTEESQDIAQGSMVTKFGRHPDPGAGEQELRFYTGPKTTDDDPPYSANWEYGVDRPDPDPAGGPIDLAMAGMLIDPPETPQGTEVTLKLTGGKVGAYAA
jgi:hypothetical protein